MVVREELPSLSGGSDKNSLGSTLHSLKSKTSSDPQYGCKLFDYKKLFRWKEIEEQEMIYGNPLNDLRYNVNGDKDFNLVYLNEF
ncbi:hypothetical protein AX774_g5980 [Zancudomyces culisetae]|uniref:Uncharacterized protein n=1 Tax=Zancudomyces culisetae TaxID=1213189 RepID=A0A1R1PIA4_ZANCU|nr:hypothetical protein AX774_g5980 [Zancudomyces culisetae]|eukprot:OMH80582.1 hypothetical protein AX774_g5980 [Zancudomyces culisetae]